MKFENAEVSVIKSKRKTISIQVKPNEIIIRAPMKMKEKEIKKIAESKRNWIEKHLQSLSEKQKLFKNIEPYSEEEIKSFIKKAKAEIPKYVEFYAEKIGVTYVQDIATTDMPISESVIKNIHSLVLINKPEDKGTYRRIPVRIMGAYTEPLQPYMVQPAMEGLLIENNKRTETTNIIERIALFHLEFEGIHPFIDGNGRTGRLIMNLDLIRNGYPPINVKFTDRKRYYDVFDAYYRDNDASKMTALIAEYVNERLDEYLTALEGACRN